MPIRYRSKSSSASSEWPTPRYASVASRPACSIMISKPPGCCNSDTNNPLDSNTIRPLANVAVIRTSETLRWGRWLKRNLPGWWIWWRRRLDLGWRSSSRRERNGKILDWGNTRGDWTRRDTLSVEGSRVGAIHWVGKQPLTWWCYWPMTASGNWYNGFNEPTPSTEQATLC